MRRLCKLLILYRMWLHLIGCRIGCATEFSLATLPALERSSGDLPLSLLHEVTAVLLVCKLLETIS